MSSDKHRQKWESLSEKDKKSLIISVTSDFDNDSLLYKGYKLEYNQQLQYPRSMNNGLIVGCPYSIKKGLLMQGLAEIVNSDDEEMQLIEKGVTSYKIKDASISLNADNIKNNKNEVGIYDDIWKKYFSNYSMIS